MMSTKDYLLVFLFCFGSTVIALMLFYPVVKTKVLVLHNGVIAKAVITKSVTYGDAGVKEYEFWVKGEKIGWYCNDYDLPGKRVGDTIFVKYVPDDPTRCAVLNELDGSVVKFLARCYK